MLVTPNVTQREYIMPLYTIINDKTNETEDLFCSYKDMQKTLKEKGDSWRNIIGTPNFVSHTGNIVNKTSGDWKDLLKGIKKGSGRGTNINT